MSKAQRITKQKTRILEILRSVDFHPTAEWVYQEARKSIPSLSLGTVYRNLNQLRENGEISELKYGSSQSRYGHRADHHYHFVCEGCSKIVDIPMAVIKSLENKAKSITTHKIHGHRLEFFGLCKECSAMLEGV